MVLDRYSVSADVLRYQNLYRERKSWIGNNQTIIELFRQPMSKWSTAQYLSMPQELETSTIHSMIHLLIHKIEISFRKRQEYLSAIK